MRQRTLVVSESDDLGAQSALLVSPETMRGLVFPPLRRCLAFIKRRLPGAKVFFHSCGAVREILPDFIEMGIDILNPVQYTAAGMDLAGLKRDFGKDLVFWGGGVDTQNILAKCTPSQVADEVKRTLDILAPGGGFVFAPVHNVQEDVPPENFWAMWEAWERYGSCYGGSRMRMRLGCFGYIKDLEDIAAAGYDCAELHVKEIVGFDEAGFRAARAKLRSCGLPAEVFDNPIPLDSRIADPSFDLKVWGGHLEKAADRCAELGARYFVFGNGKARSLPTEGDVAGAKRKLDEFLHLLLDIAAERNITVLIEPLGKKLSNIVNSLPEAVELIGRFGRPNLKTFIDYRYMVELGRPLAEIAEFEPYIRHVHLDNPRTVFPRAGGPEAGRRVRLRALPGGPEEDRLQGDPLHRGLGFQGLQEGDRGGAGFLRRARDQAVPGLGRHLLDQDRLSGAARRGGSAAGAK